MDVRFAEELSHRRKVQCCRKRQEVHETTVKNYQKKAEEAEDVIQTLKEVAKKTHGELER